MLSWLVDLKASEEFGAFLFIHKLQFKRMISLSLHKNNYEE